MLALGVAFEENGMLKSLQRSKSIFDPSIVTSYFKISVAGGRLLSKGRRSSSSSALSAAPSTALALQPDFGFLALKIFLV